MSNNAYLVNCEKKTACSENVYSSDIKYKLLATGANKVPVPWFFCFQEQDLVDVTSEMESSSGEKEVFTYKAPVLEVEKAIENLKNSKELMIAFCQDEVLGTQYWERAVADFKSLTYPYIFLDPLEVFYLNDPEEEAKEFLKCFSRDENAFKSIKILTFYNENVLPYEVAELYGNSELDDFARTCNSASMDMGLDLDSGDASSKVEQESEQVKPDEKAQNKKSWWKFW
ncbi:hypothetical protein [Pseudoalteromonas umbrosa]|uniref:hypothetical protein n=1 Tax=Pseudoalteromonas umbrosa TaxID=3048489 RepID=UPI0024C342FA|nr:hypothetical protein [Pseudoalteromonas sp. B95]MDK1286647.1 hypothetical protein [Pseudoalteromonas sp. B95]